VISVVVEGSTDVPYVKKLCVHAGVEFLEPFVVRRGKLGIDADLPKYANAAKSSPYLIVRDLDQDAACAPEWLAANAPKNGGRWLVLRLAVREVEAWFLADVETAAKCLRVNVSNVPVEPDALADPKATIVELARRSTKKSIREHVAPGPRDSRKVGPQYEQLLIEWADKWRVDVAIKRSPSLRHAHKAVQRVWRDYGKFVEGGG
jgi:hypothetical protein